MPDPADQADIPHPRLGFFGVIDERMDSSSSAERRLRPDWQFVMLGPVVKIDPADLPRLPNIHWLGGKTYDELPAYLAGWDVGFMPFALNEATRYISPTKTPEFLAAGMPVVSTPITDVVRPYGEKRSSRSPRRRRVRGRERRPCCATAPRGLARAGGPPSRHHVLGPDLGGHAALTLIRTAMAAKPVSRDRRDRSLACRSGRGRGGRNSCLIG